jgi:hypothetical protein
VVDIDRDGKLAQILVIILAVLRYNSIFVIPVACFSFCAIEISPLSWRCSLAAPASRQPPAPNHL